MNRGGPDGPTRARRTSREPREARELGRLTLGKLEASVAFAVGHGIHDERRKGHTETTKLLREPLCLFPRQAGGPRDRHEGRRRWITKKRNEGLQFAREVHEVARELAKADDLAVLEEH